MALWMYLIVRAILKKVDEIVRADDDIEKALDLVDKEILVSEIGIEKSLCRCARTILIERGQK